MNGNRFHICLALVAVAMIGQFSHAQLPAYRKLDPNVPVPDRLRAAPLMQSRFPTTFSIALYEDNKMRTIDINGRVWQRPVRQSDERVLVTETGSEPACAVLSKDARLLAFANPDGSVAVLNLDSKKIQFRDTAAMERTVTLSFSSDASSLAGVTVGGKVRVWDVGNGKLIREMMAKQSPVQTIAFSPDGQQLAIASFTREVKLHHIGERDCPSTASERVIQTDGSRVTSLAFSSDGKQLVIAVADGTAIVHDLAIEGEPIALATHPFAIWSIAFEPHGQRMASGSWDGTIKTWDTESWELLQSLKTHEESVAAMIFDNEQGLVSAGLDGTLLYWSSEVESIRPSGMIAGRADSVWAAVYTPDGKKLFVGGREKRFELWDVQKNKLLVSREGHPTTRCAAFSPDGKTLATGGDDGKIFLSDTDTGKTNKTLLRHRGAVSAVVFIDNGRELVSVCDGGSVKVWDTTTGKAKSTWREHKQQIYCASISPDGTQLISGGGNWTTGDPGELVVWELKTGRVRAKLGHKLAVWSIVFTSDGKHFASSDSSGAVKVWNLETLEEERTLQHTTWVRALAVSPNGTTLAVGRGDGSVRLWDTATWKQKAACDGHDSFTFSIQYSPGGETLATSGNDGTVRFWRTEL